MLTFTKTKNPKDPGPMIFNDRSLIYSAERTLELINKYTKKIGKKLNETHNISAFWIFPYRIDIRYIYTLYMENKIDHTGVLALYPSEKGYRLYMVSFDSYELSRYIVLQPFQQIFKRSKMQVQYQMGPERSSGFSFD